MASSLKTYLLKERTKKDFYRKKVLVKLFKNKFLTFSIIGGVIVFAVIAFVLLSITAVSYTHLTLPTILLV